jgi:tetratricopeptide (TPR) repeat protein
MRLPFLALLLFLPAIAGCDFQGGQDLSACVDGDLGGPKTRIKTCIRALEAADSAEDKAKVHYALGEAHRELDDDAAALAEFDKAIAAQPDMVDAYASRGWLLMKLERFAAAGEDFAQATRLDPKNGYVQFGKVVALEHQDQYQRALENIDRAILLLADDPGARAGARGERCWIRAVLGIELDAAIIDCDANLAEEEDAWNVMNSRGMANYRLGNHAEAVADYDRSLEGDDAEPSSYYMRGIARHALGQIEAGNADIEQALRLDPKVADEYAGYGIARVPTLAAPATVSPPAPTDAPAPGE